MTVQKAADIGTFLLSDRGLALLNAIGFGLILVGAAVSR